MSTSQTDQDTLREQVRARYAAAATKVSAGQGDCGCGQPADCGCDSSCCGGAATAEEPGFGAELYAALDRDELPDSAVLASAATRPPWPSSTKGRPSWIWARAEGSTCS
jgi:arsenite methyltransferase